MANIIDNKDGLVFSPQLKPENVKAGVILLGVKGECTGADTYTGTTEITPDLTEQRFETAKKFVKDNLKVKAVPAGFLAGYISNKIDLGKTKHPITISDASEAVYLKPYITKEGYGKEDTMGNDEYVLSISDSEKSKLIGSNIKKGVTILGVNGTAPNMGFTSSKSSVKATNRLGSIIKSVDFTGQSYKFSENDLYAFFDGYQALESVNFGTLDFSQVANMYSMFYFCYLLETVDFSNITPPTNVLTNMLYMFYGCLAITTLDFSNWDTSGVTNMNNAFTSCSHLANVTWGSNWGANVSITEFRVNDCPLTHNSCLDLFNKLANKTETATPAATLVISTTTKALMSEDEIKIATDKGWTVS